MNNDSENPDWPSAEVQTKRSLGWVLLLPAIALVLAGTMVYSSLSAGGLLISVFVDEGHGLRDGASVRYRGIQVGTVEDLRLTEGLTGVELMVRLNENARQLAREGTQFWIVYPRVGLDGIQGIETVVGARYLAVAPGEAPASASSKQEFTARLDPPIEDTLAEGGLDIVLDAASKYGLVAGAPITYRGFWIGRVVSVDLASDATVVEVHVRIAREYRSLVRDNSVFWEESGIELDLSLTGGVTLDVGTLRSLLMGAVAMATPSYPGDLVDPGARFALVDNPEKEWLQWRPALPIGDGALPHGVRPPKPLWGRLVWRSGRFIKQRNIERSWLLPLESGLIGPTDFFAGPPEEAADVEFRLGEESQLGLPASVAQGSIALCSWDTTALTPWPQDRIRRLAEPEDCMVYAGPSLAPQSIASYRLKESSRGWEVSEDMRFPTEWKGAPVVARADGFLIGVLLLVDGNAHIAPIPEWPQ